MASPFFSGYWNQPSESRYSPSVPLKRKPESPSPKVISIPVHFVGSKNNRINSGLSRSDAALRIQRVLRGFLLRKSVNKIVKIKNEVDEIERRIEQNETVELIRKDSKERLRVNETLMALLFKLDSVRGIDSGVRELRKGVIRKAIALQERVDDLVMRSARENQAAVDSGDIADSIRPGEIMDDSMPIENQNPPAAIENPPAISNSNDNMPIENDEMPIENPHAAISTDSMPIENPLAAISNDNMPIENDEMPIENPLAAISNDNMPIENPAAAISMDNMPIENVIDSNVEEEGNCVVKEIVEDCNTMKSKTEIHKEDGVVTRGDNEKTMREEGGEKKSNEELQTQMIRMMSELVEKNELQTRMINSLTHRVGQLEKAFSCDKLRRSNKKKKRQHDAAANGKQQ